MPKKEEEVEISAFDDDEDEVEPERILPMEEIRDNLITAAKQNDLEFAAEMIEKWKAGEHGITPVEDTIPAASRANRWACRWLRLCRLEQFSRGPLGVGARPRSLGR